MPGFGRTDLGIGTGRPIQLSYDGSPEWKAGGVSIAWELVSALSSDTVSPEGLTVKAGKRYLRLGQPLCKITNSTSHIVTVTGSPTGGSFNVGLIDPKYGRTGFATIAYNASVAAHQAALEEFYGVGNVTVSGGGALPSNAHTVTFAGEYTNTKVPLFTLAKNNLTGGSSPSVTFATRAAVLTITGSPTGGTMGFVIVHPTTGASHTITLAFNASVADTQTAVQAVLGTGAIVTGAGAFPSNAHTILLTGSLAAKTVHIRTGTNGLTGGSSPNATVTLSGGAASGKYGPFDPNASDGRQTLARDNVVLLNESLVYDGALGIASGLEQNVEQVGGITGGRVWKRRLLANSSSDSLANGPTYANLLAVMPRLELVGD